LIYLDETNADHQSDVAGWQAMLERLADVLAGDR
jgi:hypothetical protein